MLFCKIVMLNSQTDLPELYIMHNLLSGKILPTLPYFLNNNEFNYSDDIMIRYPIAKFL